MSPCPNYKAGCSCAVCGVYDRALFAKMVPRSALPLDDIEGMDIEDGRVARTYKVKGGLKYDVREISKRGQA